MENNHEAQTTTDPNIIKAWMEARDGHPAKVETGGDEDEGILRVDFGEETEGLERIEWEEFFDIFEKNNLAFLYQDQTKDGAISRFFKFVGRDEENV